MKYTVVELILIAGLGTALCAQTKPNFSGVWKLDVLRSRIDPKSDIKAETMKIEHAEPKLKIEMDAELKNGKRDYVVDLQTDGAESQTTMEGQSCKAVARWGTRTGERLILEITCPNGLVSTREMKLGSKDKMLTTTLVIKDARGKRKSYEFFTKE